MSEVTITLRFDPAKPGDAGDMLDAFSYLVTRLQARGVKPLVLSPGVPQGLPDDPAQPDGLDGHDDDIDPTLGDGAGQDTRGQDTGPAPNGAAAPPKRIRDRTAERRAAREKAAAEAAAAAAKSGGGAAAAADDPLLGGAAGGGAGGGDPFGDDDPLPPGPDAKPAVQDKVRTPKECMDGSIVILRQCFRAPGGADEVKALQKEYKVSKFIDLPEAVAPGLWQKAVALAGKLKVDIPAGL